MEIMPLPYIRRKLRGLRRRIIQARGADANPPRMLGAAPSNFALLAENDYRRHAIRSSLELYKFGTRMWSPDALEQLARYGTREELGWTELNEFFSTQSGEFPRRWDLSYLMSAAVLSCVIDFNEAQLRSSARALRLALSHPDLRTSLADNRLRIFAFQIAQFAGDDELFELLCAAMPSPEDVEWVARVDALRIRAFEGDADADNDRSSDIATWWDALNEPFVRDGVEPWEFDIEPGDTNDTVFARMHAPIVHDCAVPRDEQPLVSVIVPAYNPDRSFVNTIESLVRQSWHRLEILIIDDASPRGADIIAEAAALDDRVRLITLEQNGGAYHARNTGIGLATGAFVTVLDADDQSHSRRIERQMAPLLADDSLVATASQAIRVYSDGSLITFGATALRRNASSLLFRREQVLAALGTYDEVYKAADTEYILRMQLRFGRSSVRHMDDVLSLIQLTGGSLSRGDFLHGWWSGRRVAYRHQYFTWHKLALRSPEANFAVAPNGARAFTAPATFLKQPEPKRLQVAMLADWGKSVEKTHGWAAGLRALSSSDTDTPTGLLHGVHPRASQAGREFILSRGMWDLVEDGVATWISWDQDTEIDTLIVPDPEYLVLLPFAAASNLRVRRVVIMVDSALRYTRRIPYGIPGPQWIAERCERVFGVSPDWLPATPSIAVALGGETARVLEPGRLFGEDTQTAQATIDQLRRG